MREDGFFYVKNFNISQERVNRQFSIGKQFYEIPLEEKLKYVPEGLGECTFSSNLSATLILGTDNGKFNGYVPSGRRILEPVSGIRDHTEVYNIPSAFVYLYCLPHPFIFEAGRVRWFLHPQPPPCDPGSPGRD